MRFGMHRAPRHSLASRVAVALCEQLVREIDHLVNLLRFALWNSFKLGHAHVGGPGDTLVICDARNIETISLGRAPIVLSLVRNLSFRTAPPRISSLYRQPRHQSGSRLHTQVCKSDEDRRLGLRLELSGLADVRTARATPGLDFQSIIPARCPGANNAAAKGHAAFLMLHIYIALNCGRVG